ncbi:hypothetical protein C8Q79DRAFT_925228 [Trametes meyenii]|nr:hypothetical protein C8Q79DRAFT_925228 [Trametes meyenii]
MERAPSTASRRIRKLSNSIACVVKHGKFLATPQNGEPQRRPKARKRTRRISVDQISKPKPDPRYSLDGWLTKDDLQRSGTRLARRSDSPRLDYCIPAARETTRERRRSASVPRRPPRPQRDEDLPYGVKGDVPIRHAPSFMAFPDPSTARVFSKARDEPSVPFPPTVRRSTSTERRTKPLPPLPVGAIEETRQMTSCEGTTTPMCLPRAPSSRVQKTFSPFAPTAPTTREPRQQAKKVKQEIAVAATPRSPLNASFSPKPKPRGVPRDVTSTDHDRLSVLLGSSSVPQAQPRARSLPIATLHDSPVHVLSSPTKPKPREPFRPVSPPQPSYRIAARTVGSRKLTEEAGARGEYSVTYYLDEVARGFGEVPPLSGLVDAEHDGRKDNTEPLRVRRKHRETAKISENSKAGLKEIGRKN